MWGFYVADALRLFTKWPSRAAKGLTSIRAATDRLNPRSSSHTPMPEPVLGPKPSRLTIVLADWCPHCVPLSEEKAHQLGRRLGIPVRRLDIDDPAEEREADALVEAHGDWTPDYLIPQVFLEWTDGRVDHILTGIPGGVSRTSRAWDELFESDWLRRLAPA
jgi:hypothetical protein